jgi:uncharacterized protein (DUF4213/DUF364 family)
MNILTDIISTLNLSAEVMDIRQGVFHTAVLTRRCGLAATLLKDALKQSLPLIKEPGRLLEKSASELVRMSFSDSILEAAIGMASINSLIEVEEKRCVELNAGALIAEKGKEKKVAIVGHFPFVDRLKHVARELWVIEKNPLEGDLTEKNAELYVPEAEVVGVTGSALTNHTMDHLLSICSPDAYVVVLGDTTPLSPVLFEYGVDAVSGTLVINNEQALRCVSQGANFRQINGIRLLTLMK